MAQWNKVLCSHEERQDLSTGPWLGDKFPGVALPCVEAIFKWVILRYKERTTLAQVMDLGPWCQDDREYVLYGKTPRAEIFKGKHCPLRIGITQLATVPNAAGEMKGVEICNGAGIDLFPRTAQQLGIEINDNVTIEWAFAEL